MYTSLDIWISQSIGVAFLFFVILYIFNTFSSGPKEIYYFREVIQLVEVHFKEVLSYMIANIHHQGAILRYFSKSLSDRFVARNKAISPALYSTWGWIDELSKSEPIGSLNFFQLVHIRIGWNYY